MKCTAKLLFSLLAKALPFARPLEAGAARVTAFDILRTPEPDFSD
jgi:hypothetical protein